MSSVPIDKSMPADIKPASASALARYWNWFEERLNFIGDYLNPILVKETRQALKSRQFVFSFVLVLIACWLITIIGVLYLGPGIYYSASGGMFLKWYNYVLMFPLAVVVPFSAFRSLLTEREDNTYDLLTVTSLSPRQIINGKLGSALVQMAVYFSATAPCLAFTYLLRGIDVLSIAILLTATVLGSFGLSMFGLTLAAASKRRVGQTFTSVGFIVALVWAFGMAVGGVTIFVDELYQFVQDWEFWLGSILIVTLYVCLFVTLYLSSTALITFSAANRSTPLRWSMLLHQMCFVGWMAFAWFMSEGEEEVPAFGVYWAACYWYIMGTFLVSEPPVLSNRVRRSLPQSVLGRMTLSWLNPGSGTGYGFVVANLAFSFLLAAVTLLSEYTIFGTNTQYFYLLASMIIACSYAVAYLGLGRLFLAGMRRFGNISTLAGFLINILLVTAGAGIPLVIQSSFRTFRYAGYTWLQLTNPFWSTEHVWSDQPSADTFMLMLIVPAAAACMWLANLPAMAREICQTRLALPSRVQLDEAQLHPVVAVPTSPWDLPDEDATPS